MTRIRQRLVDDLRGRNYSPDTIRGYIRAVQQFAEYFGRSPEQMGAEDLRRYQIHLLHERKLALGTVENCISALRFLYKKTLKRRALDFDDLPFPKQPRTRLTQNVGYLLNAINSATQFSFVLPPSAKLC